MYPPQRSHIIERDAFIRNAQNKFTKGEFNVVSFFDHIIKYVDLQQYNIDLLNEENDVDEEEESMYCLQFSKPGYNIHSMRSSRILLFVHSFNAFEKT